MYCLYIIYKVFINCCSLVDLFESYHLCSSHFFKLLNNSTCTQNLFPDFSEISDLDNSYKPWPDLKGLNILHSILKPLSKTNKLNINRHFHCNTSCYRKDDIFILYFEQNSWAITMHQHLNTRVPDLPLSSMRKRRKMHYLQSQWSRSPSSRSNSTPQSFKGPRNSVLLNSLSMIKIDKSWVVPTRKFSSHFLNDINYYAKKT